MSQLLSHKDTSDSPRVRFVRRNDQSSSPPVDRERTRLFLNAMQQSSELLDQVCYDPDMPDRSNYVSHDDWVRALLTASLEQAPDMSDVFGQSDEVDVQPTQPKDPAP